MTRLFFAVLLFVVLPCTTFIAEANTPSLVVNVVTDNPDFNINDSLCDSELTAGNQCSLRAAIQNANADSDTDTINLNVTGTIVLNTALPTITAPLNIHNDPLTAITITRNPEATTDFSLLRIASTINLTLNHIHLIGNSGTVCGNFVCGGAIYNNGGYVSLYHSTVEGRISTTIGRGGAIYTNGGLIGLTDTIIASSQAHTGAGIFAATATSISAENTVWNNNEAAFEGGGLYMEGTVGVNIRQSLFTDNRAPRGGVFAINTAGGYVDISNSTFSRNAATQSGGGIFVANAHAVQLTNVTMNEATAPIGADIHNQDTDNNVTAYNSLVLSGCSGNIVGIHSMTTSSTCTSGFTQVTLENLYLGELANNGGPTLTYALLPGSVAVNMGNNYFASTVESFSDQRGEGYPRFFDYIVDIGAFELQQVVPALVHNPIVNVLSDASDLNVYDNVCDSDSSITGDQCSLRAAIEIANVDDDLDTITFAVTGTIDLTTNLNLTTPVIITGPGARDLIISAQGNDNFSVFNIVEDIAVNITDLTVTNALSVAINNHGILHLAKVAIQDNRSAAISNEGGTLTIIDSTISGNHSSNSVAGIASGGTLTIINSTISNNRADYDMAGLLVVSGTANLYNVTVSGNIADANYDGGGSIGGIQGSVPVNTYNTLIVNNTHGVNNTPSNCGGTVINLANSISTDSTCGSDFTQHTTTEVKLSALADNGGPTLTHLLLSGSVAINAGDNDHIPDAPDGISVDQRGLPRIWFGTVDVGSVEVQTLPAANNLVVNVLTDGTDTNLNDGMCDSNASTTGAQCSLRAAIQNANADADADTILFSVTGTLVHLTGLPTITAPLTIDGPGAHQLKLKANQQNEFLLFEIAEGVNATINSITLTEIGDTIRSQGNLTLKNAIISYNGVFDRATITLFGGSSTIINSLFIGNVNTIGRTGSALFVSDATVTVINTTFSDNQTQSGDGSIVSMGSNLTFYNTTFFLTDLYGTMNSQITAYNSLFIHTACRLTPVNGSHNLSTGTHCPGVPQAPGNIGFTPLSDNGGPTQTHRLLPGSAAINAGDNGYIPTGIMTDQRGTGYTRISGGIVDVGAVEFQPLHLADNPIVNVLTDSPDINLNDGRCDSDPASGEQCNLRAAMQNANADEDADTITISVTGNILLQDMLPSIFMPLTINAPGADLFSISGVGNGIFVFHPNIDVLIDGLTLKHTRGTRAINNSARLTIRESVITQNQRGAIYNMGQIRIENSTVSLNDGGGIDSRDNSTLVIINSTLSTNIADSNASTLHLQNSSAELYNVTIVSSSPIPALVITNSNLTVANTIITNEAGSACAISSTDITDTSYNLATDATCAAIAANQVTPAQLKLGPLANNGGTTPTHALGYTSIAIDAGIQWSAIPTISTDQRGVPRPFDGNFDGNGALDIGAFEFNTDMVQEVSPVMPVTPTVPPPFRLSLPVLTNIDGGGLDWITSGGWTTHAAANFTGSGGLGWQITALSNGTYTLQWQHQINLATVNNPRLTFASRLAASTSSALVQIRVSGTAPWTTLATLSPTADWQTVMLDLSAYKGSIIDLRFAWIARSSTDLWRIDNVYLFDMPAQSIPGAPANPVIEIPAEIILPNDLIVEPTPEPTPDAIIVPVDPQ